MTNPSSSSWIAALLGVCAISYGLGNGWIRLGPPTPPDDGAQSRRGEPAPVAEFGALDPSALAVLEPTPEARRSAPLDARVTLTQAPADDPITDPAAKKKAIDDAVATAKAAILDALIKLADVQAQITAGANLSNAADAAVQITAAARIAADPVVDGAIRSVASVVAVAAAATPKPSDITTAFATATTTLTATPPADAKTAALAAIAAKAKGIAGARTALTDAQVTITYSIGGAADQAWPADGKITSDGPDITFKASVVMSSTTAPNRFNDSGARVTLELKPHSDSFKPYLTVPASAVTAPIDGTPAALSIKTLEAGSYDLIVTVTPTDRAAPPAFTKSVVVTPQSTNARPTIESLKAMQDDRLVTFDLQGASVIEVLSGRLTVGAAINLPKRNLTLIDAGDDVVLTSRNGAPVVQPTDTPAADKTYDLSVAIPDDRLTDSPRRIAVVDLWSREASNALTVVIPGDGGKKLPSQTVGISGRTGENAVFAEYTDPRPIPDGFKPSDKVETRVSRLYYYRDAHRVAQIVNRDAKSYNRIAVDTRRRMADDARDEADALTDTRRLDEIVSIRSAQAARVAEQKVRQAQNDLDAAVRAEAKAASDIPTLDGKIDASEKLQALLQTQIEDANKQLSAAKALPDGDPTKAAAVGAAQVEVTRLTVQRNNEVVNHSRLTQQKSAAQAIIDGKKGASAQVALDNARTAAEAARTTEAAQSDARVRGEQLEDRARENQFRQEVAAAHEDPDTYVPGKPRSKDPVLQVSVSVIGEGLLQLRGPIKGINEIRTMINQIDAPTSQVRVGIHTVQINGEHGDRIEKVATRIQDYVDHSRFLTSQSAQMLRNAVVKVAAEKAHEAAMSCPNVAAHLPGVACPDDTQEARDARYQEAFFGCDFISELRAIDSEFLMTGNKLLSLHSMDTTSLASALFLIALAKNDVRMQILDEFQQSMQVALPAAENTYYAAGAVGRAKDHHNEFKMFACNAKFQSFMGFFDAQVAGSETLNPLQREFLKLAQIFKSRLVTELEYRQRVSERGLLEDRIDPILNRTEARKQETEAQKKLVETIRTIRTQRSLTVMTLARFQQKIVDALASVEAAKRETGREIPDIVANARPVAALTQADRTSLISEEMNRRLNNDFIVRLGGEERIYNANPDTDRIRAILNRVPNRGAAPGLAPLANPLSILTDNLNTSDFEQINAVLGDLDENAKRMQDDDRPALLAAFAELRDAVDTWEKTVPAYVRALRAQRNAVQVLSLFKFGDVEQGSLDGVAGSLDGEQVNEKPTTEEALRKGLATLKVNQDVIQLLLDGIRSRLGEIRAASDDLLAKMAVDKPRSDEILRAWYRLKDLLLKTFREAESVDVPAADKPDPGVSKTATDVGGASLKGLVSTAEIEALDQSFTKLFQSIAEFEGQLAVRDISHRRLDQKRLLDMLIDDVEDKYIDLLEGTRSHTANIDAYIKRIATALDDDFNTQFYYPAFTEIRRASRFHDVQLGKIETTNVLANNRGFGKVEPQATMEFDLPKRDILINEAMNGALAMTKDFGALVNDPTFLSMAKLRSGQPTSSLTPGAGEGVNTVRNALPGLSRADDEQLFSQQGAGRTQFGSAMEALIPDPAVYKFETGTGFEVRPVVQPDGQSVVFDFKYMYTTNVREPVRADEKHLGRVKRHFIDTDVQLGNYELREVSRYQVALKASRTSRGVPLFEDIPGVGVLFRPLPSAESALQENIVLGQSTIFPTLFDLMGLRWAPAVADLDTLRLRDDNYIVRGRYRDVQNRVFDISSGQVDEFLQIPPAERHADRYRSQETVPDVHPNGYRGPGLNYQTTRMREGYDPTRTNPERGAIPGESRLANPRTPTPPPPALIEEGAEQPIGGYRGAMNEAARIEGAAPPSNVTQAAPRPRIAPPRQVAVRPPARAVAPSTRPAPGVAPPARPATATRPAPVVAPPARPAPPLSGPATSWQRSSPAASSASPIKDPAVGRAAFDAARPVRQPRRQGLFSRMLGAGE